MTPVYEYKCECGKKFEKLVFSTDKVEVRCPECNSVNIKKQFSLISTSRTPRGISYDISHGTGPRGRGAEDIGSIK